MAYQYVEFALICTLEDRVVILVNAAAPPVDKGGRSAARIQYLAGKIKVGVFVFLYSVG